MPVETGTYQFGGTTSNSAKPISAVPEEISATSRRKDDHISICLENDVQFSKGNGFDKYDFTHKALPELNLTDIDTSTTFLDRNFSFPFFIEALTGGSQKACKINQNLASAAERFGIGMGVGSQRAMLDRPELGYTYKVRDKAPGILLFGNIGATQLVNLPIEKIAGLVEEIGAEGMAVHLNATQEMCQPEGDTDWRNILDGIEKLCHRVPFPVMVKETGCGIDETIARQLETAGVACIDIAGAGGTSFTKVEYYRGSKTSKALFEWGIPTAHALWQCRNTVQTPLIASGGMRNGVECAKAISMGASLVGFALPLLKAAQQSSDEVVQTLTTIGEELKKTMLLVGAKDIEVLKKVRILSPKRRV